MPVELQATPYFPLPYFFASLLHCLSHHVIRKEGKEKEKELYVRGKGEKVISENIKLRNCRWKGRGKG